MTTLFSPMLSPSNSADSLSPSTPSLSTSSSSTSLSSVTSSIGRSSRTNDFFSVPFLNRPPSPSPPSKSQAKTLQLPHISKLFPSRSTSQDTSLLPTPQQTRPKFVELETRDETPPTVSIVIPELKSTNDLTPRPPPQEPMFVTSNTEPSIGPGSIITSPLSRSSSTSSTFEPLPSPHSHPSILPTVDDFQDIKIELVRSLGQGAFSSVWLGKDMSERPLQPLCRVRSKRSRQAKATNGYLSIRGTGGGIDGTTPCKSVVQERRVGSDSNSADDSDRKFGRDRKPGRLVAVKMTPRATDEGADFAERTRVSFIREVEILEHISHPYITPLLGSFTTSTHHALVLPYLKGGDLLSLVNTDHQHAQLSERTLQTMWRQLCSAVGWMHSVGLVHRDIKLENILLTWNFPFPENLPPHVPLIKLTDFGLSRFIDMSSPLLATRCGSEAYAAPELVMRGGRYDGRDTDAWACGVVLYSLMCRRLPFGDVGSEAIGREGQGSARERRTLLMRIANGAWQWPSGTDENTKAEEELKGNQLVSCQPARRVVEKLLVRDSRKRARISNLWNDEWVGPKDVLNPPNLDSSNLNPPTNNVIDVGDDGEDLEAELVDSESIKGIARQEVPGPI